MGNLFTIFLLREIVFQEKQNLITVNENTWKNMWHILFGPKTSTSHPGLHLSKTQCSCDWKSSPPRGRIMNLKWCRQLYSGQKLLHSCSTLTVSLGNEGQWITCRFNIYSFTLFFSITVRENCCCYFVFLFNLMIFISKENISISYLINL